MWSIILLLNPLQSLKPIKPLKLLKLLKPLKLLKLRYKADLRYERVYFCYSRRSDQCGRYYNGQTSLVRTGSEGHLLHNCPRCFFSPVVGVFKGI